MSVGHGELGLRSLLRPFSELTRESACRKDAFCEIHGGAPVPGPWMASGAAWSTGWNQTFDGVPLDVTGVKVLAGVLTRVETLALCQATAWTYFYDIDLALITPPLWDDGASRWDAGLTWDEGAHLYVHLGGEVNPNTVIVQARAGFYFGTGGQERGHLIQPWLGDDKLADGDLEAWDSPTQPTYWTNVLSGAGWSVNRDTTILANGGSYSAKLISTGAAIGNAGIQQDRDFVLGKFYRLEGSYKTDQTNPGTATLYAKIGRTTFLASDGRTNSATDGAAIANSGGKVRRFLFDFCAHEDSPCRVTMTLKNTAASACAAWLDGLKCRRIYRWNFYEPRLQAEGLPESEMGASDVYPGSEETGGGQILLANGGTVKEAGAAYMERAFSPPFFFLNKPLHIRFGGTFPDGQEITDLELGYFGLVSGDRFISVNDRRAAIQIEDYRTLLEQVLPPNVFTREEFPGMDERDVGRRRSMLFGSKTGMRPTRISSNATTGLGVYEVSDPTYRANETLRHEGAVTRVWAYTTDEAADAVDPKQRVELVRNTDYTLDSLSGQVRLLQNPGPLIVAAGASDEADAPRGGSDRIDFSANSVVYPASVPPGVYTAAALAAAMASAMNAALGVALISATYSNTTHRFTLDYSGADGKFGLLLGTGANKHRSTLVLAGFTSSDNTAEQVSHVSNVPLFTGTLPAWDDGASRWDAGLTWDASLSPERVIRVDATGYTDTATGTYTGTPNATIELGPDILRFLVSGPAEVVRGLDNASFVAARTSCPQLLSAYLGVEELTVQEVIDRLEASTGADIVIDSAGTVHYVARSGKVPASAPALYDRDYLEWDGFLPGNDAYGTVEVRYDQNPSTGVSRSRTHRNDDTILTHGRRQSRTFDTFLRTEADATLALALLVALARAPTRHFAFRVKGQLLTSKVGDIVLLTRDQTLQGVNQTGGLNAAGFRILYLRKNFLTHDVEAVVHTNVTAAG